MKIGIQTLPLHTNYGGILQAYALQTVLQRMGHEVCVINCPKQHKLPLHRAPFAYAKRIIKKYILRDKSVVINLEKKLREERPIVSQYTQKFINKYLNLHNCSNYTDLKESDFDAIVVGSDQVWRPRYFRSKLIQHAYLDFAKDWNIKRIAYAPSFGTDEWEYTKTQTRTCSELLSKFNTVSVREFSAIKICKERFGVAAQHVLDPTMLLNKEDYIKLVENSNAPKSKGNLLVYVLDETKDKSNIVNKIAAKKKLHPFYLNSKLDNNYACLQDKIKMPVEQWLKGFMDAEFVVTDSFHACVFSIIFNKPFVVCGNVGRGLSRFDSLLNLFGLNERMITNKENIDNIIEAQIDWVEVEAKYQQHKKESMSFINKEL